MRNAYRNGAVYGICRRRRVEVERKVTIKKNDIEIILTIDSDIALVNGEEIKLDSPAFIENDRTYTSVRFIAENLGASVDWNEGSRKVIITK